MIKLGKFLPLNSSFHFLFIGHFTQLIWRSTKYFGIGKARSRSGKIVIVAHYLPAGNISGAFQCNVLPPLACMDYNPPSTKYIVSSSSATSGSSCNTSSNTTWFVHYMCVYCTVIMTKVKNVRSKKWKTGCKIRVCRFNAKLRQVLTKLKSGNCIKNAFWNAVNAVDF